MARRKRILDSGDLVKIVRWHFEQGWNYREIAKELQLDVHKIPDYIAEAKNQGILRISIRSDELAELEHQVRQAYPHLKRVIVVDKPGHNDEQYRALIKAWGEEAARFFQDCVDQAAASKKDIRLGISGGETLLEFVDAVSPRVRERVRICTTAIVGRGAHSKNTFSHIDPIVNATLLWVKCGRLDGHCLFGTAPPYDLAEKHDNALSEEMRNLARRQVIRDLLAPMEEIDIAFVGLGIVNHKILNPSKEDVIHHGRITMMKLIPSTHARELLKAGVIGDIGYCLFDEYGRGKPEWELFITSGYPSKKNRGVEFYRSMVAQDKTVVVIAGAHKDLAVRAGLRGMLFNVWITDKSTADASLKWAAEDHGTLPTR
jgi:DNA-binding transcriptional regulator LsrR (DeoR family)